MVSTCPGGDYYFDALSTAATRIFYQPYAESELGNTSAAPAEGSDRMSHAQKMYQSGESEVEKSIWHLKMKHQPRKILYLEK